MPILDKVFFGKNDKNENVLYGDIRNILIKEDPGFELELAKLLKLRIERTFNSATNPLKEAKSAFPLTLMSCIGLSLLGEIFHSDNSNEASKPFKCICNQLHQEFSRKLTKTFQHKLSLMWPTNKEISNIDTLSNLLYKYLRNDLVHSFIAKGVYLSYEDTAKFKRVETDNEAYLVVNPDWLWSRYNELFNEYFDVKVKNKLKLQKEIVKYIKRIING